MLRLILYFEIISIIITSTSLSFAEEKTDFYDKAKTGWYWYEIVNDESNITEELNLNQYPTDTLWNMDPEKFQTLLNQFQNKAVQYPTENNVIEYLTMQDIARRKAAVYANVAAYVAQKYPRFDLVKDYPDTPPGRNVLIKMQKAEIDKKIDSSNNEHALLYFYSNSCSYCTEQSNILAFFQESYGWSIKKINIASPEASRFKIKVTPTLILIKKDSPEHITISRGVVSLETIKLKIYRGIRLLNGEITPENYSEMLYQKEGGFDYEAIRR